MNALCEACGGLCCQTLIGNTVNPKNIELLEGRTIGRADGKLFLACRCSHLTKDGKCGIYDKRPELCITYEVKGPDCMSTLKALRPDLHQAVMEGKYG